MKDYGCIFFINILFCRRPAFDAAALQNRNHLPTLDSLRWRVDVAISTRWVQVIIWWWIDELILFYLLFEKLNFSYHEVNKLQNCRDIFMFPLTLPDIERWEDGENFISVSQCSTFEWVSLQLCWEAYYIPATIFSSCSLHSIYNGWQKVCMWCVIKAKTNLSKM